MTETSRLASTFKSLCLLRFTSLQSECTSQKQDQAEIMCRAPQASPVATYRAAGPFLKNFINTRPTGVTAQIPSGETIGASEEE